MKSFKITRSVQKKLSLSLTLNKAYYVYMKDKLCVGVSSFTGNLEGFVYALR